VSSKRLPSRVVQQRSRVLEHPRACQAASRLALFISVGVIAPTRAYRTIAAHRSNNNPSGHRLCRAARHEITPSTFNIRDSINLPCTHAGETAASVALLSEGSFSGKEMKPRVPCTAAPRELPTCCTFRRNIHFAESHTRHVLLGD
jgi:hypothetical protein